MRSPKLIAKQATSQFQNNQYKKGSCKPSYRLLCRLPGIVNTCSRAELQEVSRSRRTGYTDPLH